MEENTHQDQRRNAYWSLINQSLYQQFPRFVKNLRAQTARQRELGRAAVLEFREGEPAAATHFKGSEDLRRHLDEPGCLRSPPSERGPYRRLWLLEDLSRNYIEVLGSRLLIHPSFFAGNWADPSGADFNERDSFVLKPRRRFLLKWPQFHRISMDRIDGDLRDARVAMDCNVERHLFFSGREDVTYENPLFARSYHNISFWSTENLDGSWDAVLLIDPPLTESVVVLPTHDTRKVDLYPDDDWYPEKQPPYPAFNTPNVLPADIREWSTSTTSPTMNFIFDDIISIYHGKHHTITQDPESCTLACRKMVIAYWIAFLRRRYLNLLSISALVAVARTNTDHINRTRWLNQDLDFSHQKGIYGNLANGKFKLDMLIKEITGNIAALGLDPLALGRPPPPGSAAADGVDDGGWEREGWRSVLDWTATIAKMIDIYTQCYTHASSIQEAKTANSLTRSVTKISYLATLFVPISVVSGIFSMSGAFQPGGSMSWVFWAVSCPVMTVVSLILFTNVGAFVTKRFRGLFGNEGGGSELPLYEKKPEK